MTKGKSSQKKKKLKDTSNPLQDTHFDPVKIEIENPHNLLLLLNCEDYRVQVQALYHLKKYLSKANATIVESMLENKLLNNLLPLIKSQDLCIKKLSYAILSQVIEFPPVRSIFQDPNWTETLLDAFSNRSDLIILENIMKIFSSITDDEIGKSFLVSSIPLEKISACLDIDDPDIKKHTLKTISNYLDNETVEYTALKMENLVKMIDSEYPIIQQLTLDVLNIIMKRHDGLEARLKFKQLGGFSKLMNYLEKPEYEDIHPSILKIFGSITDNEKYDIMEPNNLKRLLLLSRKILNVDKLELIWSTIIRLADSKKNNQILTDYNIMETIKHFLKSSNERLIVVGCKAITQLLKDLDLIESVLSHISIEELAEFMEKNVCGKTKEAVMTTLLQLLKFHTIDEKNALEMETFSFILKTLASSNEDMGVSIELLREVIICLTVLAQNSFYRERLDAKEYIDQLSRNLLEFEDDQLKTNILKCLSQLVYDDRMCKVLCDGHIEKLWENFVKNDVNIKVSVAMGQFILIASSAQQLAANSFVRAGTLQWLTERDRCDLLPVWLSVMTTLFENHLSAKFNLYGRLEFTDLIRDKFYAWRLRDCKDKASRELCPLYEDLHKLCSTEVETDSNIIYVVNLNQSILKDSVDSRSSTQSAGSLGSKRSLVNRGSEEGKISSRKHSSTHSSSFDTSKFALCGDPYLRERVSELRETLREEEKNTIIEEAKIGVARNVFDTQKQLEIVADFVCAQLSGADNDVPCTKHYIDLHISDLKAEVRSIMVPLGLLRLGLSFERSLLFKALADQVGLACALVRGDHGHGWVEVALSTLDKVPTHVVDLMHTPGKLMELKSHEADEYKSCPKLFTANY